LRARLGATRDAGRRLVGAHIELAKAEMAEIGGKVARLAGLLGCAFMLLALSGLLLFIGSGLFLGEWLFGSMGWGILHGAILLPALAVAAVLAGLGLEAAWIGRRLAAALGIGLIAAVVLGLAWPNVAYREIGLAVGLAVDEAYRPLVAGIGTGALVIAIVAVVIASRSGTRVILGALIGGAVIGAALGAFTAISFELHVGIALGLTIAYAAWIILMGIGAYRAGIDPEALKARFYPTTTIDTTKETLEWLKERMPPGIGS
jgi:hypothetical protein